MSVIGRPPTNVIAPGQQLVDLKSGGMLQTPFVGYFAPLDNFLASVQAALGPVLGVNQFAFAAQPALGTSDAGFVGFVTDYRHLVLWDGAAWQWLDGDQPGKFVHYSADPGIGWQICDGSATNFLVVGGGTLTTSNIMLPNTNASYLKDGPYAGAIVAAVAPGATMSGSTAAGTIPAFVTGQAQDDVTANVMAGADFIVETKFHDHRVPAGAGDITVPALGVGTLATAVDATGEPPHLLARIYFRR